MKRMLIIAIIFPLITGFQSQDRKFERTGKCSYFGEPHLIPFPQSYGQPQDQYLCHPNTNEWLIKNNFLEILVIVDPNGNYPIVKYTIVFHPTSSHQVPCIITNSLNNPSTSQLTCPSGSPVQTVTSGQSQSYIHLTESIQVDIDNQGRCFDIYITQSFDLIEKSEGICIKWDCPLEISPANRKKRILLSTPVIGDICETVVQIAQKQAVRSVDKNLIASRMDACIYDIHTTLDQRYARTIVTSIIRDSVKEFQNDNNYQLYLFQVGNIAQQVIKETDKVANDLIAQAKPFCRYDNGENRCLQVIDETNQKS